MTTRLSEIRSHRPDPDSVLRPFMVDDLFELEGIGMYFGGPYAWTADGTSLAFTRVRAKKTLANHKWEYLWGNASADIWVLLSSGAQPENITNGVEDGSGWWSPQWSPDGEKLAMLSTRGGNVRVWVWDRGSRELTQLSERGIDLYMSHERPYLWVDDQRLLYPGLPDGEQPLGMKVELQTPMIATREWPKVGEGMEVTASVLQSGVEVDQGQLPRGELRVVEVTSGTETIIAQGRTRSCDLSPNGQTVAFTRIVAPFAPQPSQRLRLGFFDLLTLDLAALDGAPLKLEGELSQDVLAGSVRWSPDGDEVVFLGYSDGRERPPLLYRVNVPGRSVVASSMPDLDVAPIVGESPQLEWTAGGDLIVFGAKASKDTQFYVTGRRDWWRVRKAGAPELLTADLENPPRKLWPQEGRHAFVGLSDGELWRIEPGGGATSKVTESFDSKAHTLSWPAMTNNGDDEYRLPARTYTQVIFSVQNDHNLDYHLVDLHSGAIEPIGKPDNAAELVAYEPQTATAIFYASDRNGLRVWRRDVDGGEPYPLVQANGFLGDVAEGEFRKLEYTSLNGEVLTAWLLLPVGFREGERYPLLTWVYPGSVQGERPISHLGTINSGVCLNMQIPAARGYAVLFPSMPLAPEGVTDDPMLRLPEGVLPAVDKAIESGVADPNRLYVMGQSFGGFSVYGLVTQTKRFHAAVSLAGLSNLISLYGQFGARDRYTDRPQDNLFFVALMESAQTGMGSPPWKDLGRYIRNSPIFFVDRVETPLMIVQGDMDYVAIQQGEEFFMSLYRQGKRASFVRYWGEGHLLQSPANIRDFWARVFDWLEQFPAADENNQEKG